MARSNYLRVNERSKRAITRIAGRLQSERGKRVSADAALWGIIEEHDPRLAEDILRELSREGITYKDDVEQKADA